MLLAPLMEEKCISVIDIYNILFQSSRTNKRAVIFLWHFFSLALEEPLTGPAVVPDVTEQRRLNAPPTLNYWFNHKESSAPSWLVVQRPIGWPAYLLSSSAAENVWIKRYNKSNNRGRRSDLKHVSSCNNKFWPGFIKCFKTIIIRREMSSQHKLHIKLEFPCKSRRTIWGSPPNPPWQTPEHVSGAAERPVPAGG